MGKRYRIGTRERYGSLRDALALRLNPRSWFGRGKSVSEDDFWALQDVSFDIRQGEVVGVIGRNGAGKSTLLKILSRITEPTSGSAQVYGRVGSLLEVGTGFHPELTGRENIYLNGAILGMKKAEIAQKFDDIVDFSEVGRFLDTPVKHYSSGMTMRLAFAVAAHLEPEVLLIDEVLAVGDAAFQRKCLGKVNDVARHGRTVLFVSHNMIAVQSLCSRAIWLEGGKLRADGEVRSVAADYLRETVATSMSRQWERHDAPGNDSIRMRSAEIAPPSHADRLEVNTPVAVTFEYWNLRPGIRLNLSMAVFNQDGVCVFASTTIGETKWDGAAFPEGLFRSVCAIPGSLLNAGIYRIGLLFVKDTTDILHTEGDLLTFEIHDDLQGRGDWHGQWPGVVRPKLEWETELISEQLPVQRL